MSQRWPEEVVSPTFSLEIDSILLIQDEFPSRFCWIHKMCPVESCSGNQGADAVFLFERRGIGRVSHTSHGCNYRRNAGDDYIEYRVDEKSRQPIEGTNQYQKRSKKYTEAWGIHLNLQLARVAHCEGFAGKMCLAIQGCIQKALLRIVLLVHFHALPHGHIVLWVLVVAHVVVVRFHLLRLDKKEQLSIIQPSNQWSSLACLWFLIANIS